MILPEHKAIFVHIPKTGGTSIEQFFGAKLFARTGKHDPVSKLRQAIGADDWNRYFKFSFVRNPWDRMASYFNWRSQDPQNVDVKGRTFKDWLTFLLASDFNGLMLNRSFEYGIKPQFEMLADGDDLAVDFVGRFENLQCDFDQVCDRIGIERQTLPHKNAMNRKQHYTEFYDNESQVLVATLYPQDIEYFGYEFGA